MGGEEFDRDSQTIIGGQGWLGWWRRCRTRPGELFSQPVMVRVSVPVLVRVTSVCKGWPTLRNPKGKVFVIDYAEGFIDCQDGSYP